MIKVIQMYDTVLGSNGVFVSWYSLKYFETLLSDGLDK